MADTDGIRWFISALGGNSEEKTEKLATLSDAQCREIFNRLVDLRPYIESASTERKIILSVALKNLNLEQVEDIKSYSEAKCKEIVFSGQAIAASPLVNEIVQAFKAGAYEKRGAPSLAAEIQIALNDQDELTAYYSTAERRERIDAAFETVGVYGFLRQHGVVIP